MCIRDRLNAARILTSTAALLGVDFDAFAALALSAEPGAGLSLIHISEHTRPY